MFSLKKLILISHSLRIRLNIIYMSLFGISIVCLSLFITNQYFGMARKDFDQSLYNYALDLSDSIKGHNQVVELKLKDIELKKVHPFTLHDSLICLRNIKGEILYSNLTNKKGLPFIIPLALKKDYHHRFYNHHHYRGLNVKIPHPQFKEIIIQVAGDYTYIKALKRQLSFILLLVLPITFILTSFAGFWAAGKALEPIPKLIGKVHDLIDSNNFKPLAVTKTNDEIEELTITFNQFLVHMEQTLKAQENFLAQASHQLFTPLAIINGEIDVLLAKERTQEEVQAFHLSLKEEIKRLHQLINKMLLLARAEAGKEHLNFIPNRVDELILEIVHRLKNELNNKKINLKLIFGPELTAEELSIPSDLQLLDCLLENLIENAVKYSPLNGSVRIEISKGSSKLKIEIIDEGQGLDLFHINSGIKHGWIGPSKSQGKGHGLGLIICHKIAKLHGFQLNLKNANPHGAHLEVILPLPFLQG